MHAQESASAQESRDRVKICVLGYTQAGKSTAAGILAKHLGAQHADTSDPLIEELADSIGVSPDHIRKNKADYRGQLFKFGRARQKEDPLWPQRDQLHSADIIIGLRNPDELKVAREHKLYDIIVWINRPGVTAGPTDKLRPECADIIVENDGTIDDLRERLIFICRQMDVK